MGKTFSEIFGSGFCEALSFAEIIGMNIEIDTIHNGTKFIVRSGK